MTSGQWMDSGVPFYSVLLVLSLSLRAGSQNAGDVLIDRTYPVCRSQPSVRVDAETEGWVTNGPSDEEKSNDHPAISHWTRTGAVTLPTLNINASASHQSMVIAPDGQIIVLSIVLERTGFLDASQPTQLAEGRHAFVYYKCSPDASSGRCSVIKEEQFRSEFAIPTVLDGVMYVPDVCHSYTRRVRILDGKVKELSPVQLNMTCRWARAHSPRMVLGFRPNTLLAIYVCLNKLKDRWCSWMSTRIYVMNSVNGRCLSLLYNYENNAEPPQNLHWRNFHVFDVIDVVPNVFGCEVLLFTSHGVMILNLITLKLSVNPLVGMIAGGGMDAAENIYVSTRYRATLDGPLRSAIFKLTRQDVVKNKDYEDLELVVEFDEGSRSWIVRDVMITRLGLGVSWYRPNQGSTERTYGHLQFYRTKNGKFPGILKTEYPQMNSLFCTNVKPVDGGWSTWGNWSSCSVTCGRGLMYRYRQCSHPRPAGRSAYCLGKSSVSASCSYSDCNPESARYDEWSEWHGCSVTCGKGFRQRIRLCHVGRQDGQDCQQDGLMTEQCSAAETDRSLRVGAVTQWRATRVKPRQLALIIVLLVSILFVWWFLVSAVVNNREGTMSTVIQASSAFCMVAAEIGLLVSLFYAGYDAECKVGLVLYHWGCLMSLSLLLLLACHGLFELQRWTFTEDRALMARMIFFYYIVTISFSILLLVLFLRLTPVYSYVATDDLRCWFTERGIWQHQLPNVILLIFNTVLTCAGYMDCTADADVDITRRRQIRQTMRSGLESALLQTVSWTTIAVYVLVSRTWAAVLTSIFIILHSLHLVLRLFQVCATDRSEQNAIPPDKD